MRKEKGKYAVIGGLGGLANGLFGSGGGLFLVPLFTKWLGMEQKKAFASSVAVILPLSLVSAGIYFWKGALDLNAALPYLIGGGIGGLISREKFLKKAPALLPPGFWVVVP